MAPPTDVPRLRAGDATRDSILDAAQALFAEQGFAAASLRDLAEAAGVTRSLIHHHFGSKLELWQAVAQRIFEDYGRYQAEILARPELDLDDFAESARNLFAFLRGNPDFVRLHAWSNAAHAAPEVAPELAQLGVERLRELQKNGVMRADIDPASALVAMFNLVEHWFEARASLEGRLGAGLPDDAQFLADMLRVLVQGLRP